MNAVIDAANEFGRGVRALAPAVPGSSEVRTVFGRYAASVGAVCAVVDGQPVGIVATSLAVGVSYDPPMITFSIRKESTTWPTLCRAPRLGVSVLSDRQAAACWQIAGPSADRFNGFELEETPEGALFLHDAMTWFDCRIIEQVEAGDHLVVILELLVVGHDRESAPLIFLDGKFHALAEAVS